MNVSVAQELVWVQPDGGSGEDSNFVRKQLSDALRHYGATSARRMPATAAAETLRDVYEVLGRPEAAAVRVEATRVLRDMEKELRRFDLSQAPQVNASVLEDGSVVAEWIFADRRLGFNFDPIEGQSGWFFVSSRESGNARAYGRFGTGELGFLIAWTLKQNPKR